MTDTLIENDKKLVYFREEPMDDDFPVEYEVLPAYTPDEFNDMRKERIANAIADIDAQSEALEAKIAALNVDIDRLTNHADVLDYIVAVGSEILCGLIDSFFVGEFDVAHFEENKEKIRVKFNEFVESQGEKVRKNEQIKKAVAEAKKKGKTKEEIEKIKKNISESLARKFQRRKELDSENGTTKALKSALEVLQNKFKIPSDNLWNGAGIGVTSETHHLDDFAHHPTLIGFFAAIVSEFFRVGVFVNENGKWSLRLAKFKSEQELKRWLLQILLPILLSALLTWLIYILKAKKKEKIDEKIPKPIQKLILFLMEVPAIITVLEIAKNWLGHLISDMAGSSSSAGKTRGNDIHSGMGIPGLFMSLFKYLASVPPLNLTGLPKVVDELYRDERFDLRSELAMIDQLGKQAIPVFVGDILVRGFYFVRHLAVELKEHKELKAVNWHNVIPFKNRTIVRMMTIESGTFTAIDLADAAIRSAIKNAGQVESPTFWKDFVLRVNFVGIGRFVIAVGVDVGMGVKRQREIKERMQYKSENAMLQTAKVFYMQEGMWIEASDTEKAMQELYDTAEKATQYFVKSWNDISESVENIGKLTPAVEEKNPGLIDDMKDILKWG